MNCMLYNFIYYWLVIIHVCSFHNTTCVHLSWPETRFSKQNNPAKWTRHSQIWYPPKLCKCSELIVCQINHSKGSSLKRCAWIVTCNCQEGENHTCGILIQCFAVSSSINRILLQLLPYVRLNMITLLCQGARLDIGYRKALCSLCCCEHFMGVGVVTLSHLQVPHLMCHFQLSTTWMWCSVESAQAVV